MAEGEVRLIFSAQGGDVVTAAMQLMMDTASKLKASLKGIGGADVTAPITSLGEAFKAGAAGAESLGSMSQLLSGSMAALASPVGIAAAAIGAMVTVMGKATEVAEETYRSVRSLSAVTGLGAEETKTLQEAFKLMGLEAESMDRAMFRLSAEIETGGKRLAAYGIAVRDTNGHLRSTGEVFEDVVRKVGAIGDAAQRNAVLLQLFGRAGRELAPLFAQGGSSLDDFKKKAQELGIYTEEDQERTKELIQAKARLSEQMEHLWLDIAKAAIPVVEAFVKVLGFMVQAITAVGGLIASWVTWMATSKEAVDPLSLSVKALAASIMAVGKAIEYVQKFGKWVADRIVAPVGGTAQAAKKAEAGPAGPIVTSDDVTAQAKLREEQMKVDLKFFQEQSALTTGSHVEGLKAQQEFLAQTLALERQKVADLKALTDDPLQKEKLTRELALKEVQIEGEKRLLLVKIREAEAADAKKVIEDQLKARKDAAAEELAVIQVNRDEDLQRAERAGLSEEDLISRRKDLEINAARDAAQVKTALIAEEVAKLTTLAAQYQDNAALQREINNKLMGLAHERAMTEIEETKQVDKAKADAAKAEEARKLKEAGMFGQLIQQAQEYAKAQGRSTITQADIGAAQQKLATSSETQLASFFAGGAVDPAKLLEAQRFQQQLREQQKIGATPESITSAAMGEAGKTFGAGFSYDAATQAFQSGNVGLGQLLMKRASIMESAGGMGPAAENVGEQLAKGVDPKIAKLKEDIGTALNSVTDKWGELVQQIPDKITRWLEAEAARN